MSTNTCYYYDEQRNRCNCYGNENLNELLAENNELRKEKDFYFNQVTENGERAQRAIDVLNDENIKLRELVRIMHSELVSCEDNGYVCGGHKFDDRMRELGVEVE